MLAYGLVWDYVTVINGAGVSEDLKTFFTDVVRPRASPKVSRPRSQSDKPRSSKVMSLTDADIAGGQHLQL